MNKKLKTCCVVLSTLALFAFSAQLDKKPKKKQIILNVLSTDDLVNGEWKLEHQLTFDMPSNSIFFKLEIVK